MRNYKRNRLGHGYLYVAICRESIEARIGFSTNLYTTQANLNSKWEILCDYESEIAGLLDKKIHEMIRSERSNHYQSSKSYRLDSYRVQKVMSLLGASFRFPVKNKFDICDCLVCGGIFEAEYKNILSIKHLLDIWHRKRICNDCSEINRCAICSIEIDRESTTCEYSRCKIEYLRKRKNEMNKLQPKDKSKRVWKHYKDQDIEDI